MPRNLQYSKEQVLQAIKGSRGIKSYAMIKLGCDRKTFDSYLRRWTELQDALNEERENYKDLIESQAMKFLLDENDKAMCIYLLKTLCRDRGYGESFRVDMEGRGGNIVVLRPEEAKSIFGTAKSKTRLPNEQKQ